MDNAHPESEPLLAIMRECRALVSASTDFDWSTWANRIDALAELDDLIARLMLGELPLSALEFLFLPTSDLQEVSIQNGWSARFLELATRFDLATGSR